MKRGIDVSKWQGAVDWQKVAGHGIEFVMIRMGYGKKTGGGILDPLFRANIAGAAAAGLDIGVYFYSYALSAEAAALEGQWAVETLAPYRGTLSLHLAYDLEDETQKNLGKATLTEMCRQFLGVVRAAGYKPLLYSNLDWLRNRLDPAAIDAPIWLAQWAEKPTYSGQYVMWQYSNAGTVAGIAGKVDLNYYYGDEDMTIRDVTVTVGSAEIKAKNIDGTTYVPLRDAVDAIKKGLAAALEGSMTVTWDGKQAGVKF